jgi:translation initiation factor 3 subunit I
VFNTWIESKEKLLEIIIDGSKVTAARWGKLNKTIISGHEDGTLSIWDAKVWKF